MKILGNYWASLYGCLYFESGTMRYAKATAQAVQSINLPTAQAVQSINLPIVITTSVSVFKRHFYLKCVYQFYLLLL